MKVVYKQHMDGHAPGDVVDLDDRTAKALIHGNHAAPAKVTLTPDPVTQVMKTKAEPESTDDE